MRNSIALSLTLILAAASLHPLIAQDAERAPKPKWGSGGWHISGYGGILNDEPELNLGRTDIRRDAIIGGRAGYTFPFNLFVEAGAANALLQWSIPGSRGRNLNTFLFDGTLGYSVQPVLDLQLFGAVGAGAILWDADGAPSETDFGLKYDVGARYFVSPKLAVRADLAWHQVPNALQDTRRTLVGTAPKGAAWLMETSAGLSIYMGGPKDSDGDGVYNRYDRCPDTPRGIPVDAHGCPRDSDGDGVFDGVDRCPATPAGATVDASGCPSDQDGDRVLDGLDRCPNTPRNAVVDEHGCPMDQDGDGVYDGLDRCPDTPAGVEVDRFGCPPPEKPLPVFRNVYFDFEHSEIRSTSRTMLDRLGATLVDWPNLKIEIAGFTDSLGPAAYNLELSRKRARAVLDYLLGKYPGLDSAMFMIRGYGEANPVATNKTPEGRQENRRVEFRLKQQ